VQLQGVSITTLDIYIWSSAYLLDGRSLDSTPCCLHHTWDKGLSKLLLLYAQ